MIENTSVTDDMIEDNNIQPVHPPTLTSSTETSMELMTPCAGYTSSSSASSLIMHSSMPSNSTTVAINTDIKRSKSSATSSSTSSSLASITVDGIEFVRSDVKGIYLRVDDKGIEQISSGPFVDFQVILNDQEFKELQQRKKALTRRGHNNS